MAAAAAAPVGPILTGEWGGIQTRLSLTETGGSLELDCASASIDSAVRPDAEGKFAATGRFQAFAPGPDRSGDTAPVFTKAVFDGQVEGKNLRLRMHLAGNKTPQDFALVRDRKARIIRCY